MRTTLGVVLVLLALVPSCTQTAFAQVARAGIGGAVGVAGGAVITMSIVVARARIQNVYLESADDLIHWQSVPMLLTPAVGIMFGIAGKEPLKASVLGSTSGMLLGAGVGGAVGWLTSNDPQVPWAWAMMGAGAGMTVGGLALGIRAWTKDRDADSGGPSLPAMRLGIRIPK